MRINQYISPGRFKNISNTLMLFLCFGLVSILWHPFALDVYADASELGENGKGSRSTITHNDNNRSFVVHLGGAIVIRLNENPTTGYLWAIDKVDEKALELQGSAFAPPKGPRLGAGGLRTFTFKARSTGSAHVKLKLWREWEGDASIAERFDVTIRVLE